MFNPNLLTSFIHSNRCATTKGTLTFPTTWWWGGRMPPHSHHHVVGKVKVPLVVAQRLEWMNTMNEEVRVVIHYNYLGTRTLLPMNNVWILPCYPSSI